MKTCCAGINTVSARVPDPLASTVASLAAAGFYNPLIHIDYDSNPYAAFRMLLSQLISLRDDLLFTFQDDIEITDGLRPQLINIPVGVVSLYTSCRNDREDGWHEVECRHADGALGYIWPIEIARRFLDNCPHPDRKFQIDHWVGTFCKNEGIPYWCHSPSFIKHTEGIPSTINGGGMDEFRQCKRWLSAFNPWTVEEL